MKARITVLRMLFLLLMAAAGIPAGVHAQALPATINIVVGNPAGGTLDILARLLARGITQDTGATVIVQNVPGAGNAIALAKVASATPDGSMLLLGSSNDVVVDVVHSTDKVGALAPLGTMAMVPYVLVGRKGLDAANTDELINLARRAPKPLSVGANGVGTALHLASALLQIESNTQFTYVPYKGASQALSDLMGEHIDLCVTVLSSVLPLIQDGSVRGYGVYSQTPSPFAPDLPALSQSEALKSMRPFSDLWIGAFAPAHTPAEVLDALSASLSRVMKQPGFADKIRETGAQPMNLSAGELEKTIAADKTTFQEIISTAQLKLN